MDYITNFFPCITFIPAEVESPNYVTIYPGTKKIFSGTQKNLPQAPSAQVNLA